ncbi:putative phosphatase [Pseudomonas saudimassiliensis]|uniref:Putative phosphatase n=1 Tax=Pseudomonas saudimassiliensis TaxID=1461581 RepID=A0A078M7A7_9PSED|nr:PhoX family phosphatase [Pseudomonas saudimassiliensis]CEA02169.1 putative phosphatase [Pseudomonas saudimassiliensis]CEF25753.1 putative phosphatase [Pseudomonas saudimassiliensis]
MSEEIRNNVIVVDNGNGDEPQQDYSGNRHFASVLEARLARRTLLKSTAGAAALGFMSLGLAGCLSSDNDDDDDRAPGAGDGGEAGPLLGFTAVPTSESDDIVVPEGYSFQVILPWGTPILGSMPPFAIDNTGEEQAMQMGSHHDGMHFFPIEGEEPFEGSSEEGLLVMNHEYVEPRFMHADHIGVALGSGAIVMRDDGTRDRDQALKEINAHGVSVVHVQKRSDNRWEHVQSDYNRRITGLTPMELHGPVRGSDLVKTKYSPDGTATRGTLNNCAMGVTPWNTYMAAEENWAGYFGNRDETLPREHQRYGIRASDSRYRWALANGGGEEFTRFDATSTGASATEDYRNEPNCFGWMVEIDPFDPQSTPKKRTSLGRFGHEGVVFAPAVDGQPVVCYSGDDSTNEFIYKFVSEQPFQKGVTDGSILDTGTLYVGRFNDDGTGDWLPLVHGQNGLTAPDFVDQADVLVNTRLAAGIVGGTPMDRPEWGAVDPNNGDVYFTLTNNSGRSEANGANPRTQNRHGHIIRWAEAGGEHASTTFEWDIFLFGGDAGQSGQGNLAGAGPDGAALTADNLLSSPDGLWIDKDSRVWIQTDIGEGSQNNGVFEVFGNNAMLCADPHTGELRRFLTGPIGQEITGVITTPDQKTMFINVQHPGATTSAEEWAAGQRYVRSTWPDRNPVRVPPRSATVVIWKDDGGVIGS